MDLRTLRRGDELPCPAGVTAVAPTPLFCILLDITLVNLSKNITYIFTMSGRVAIVKFQSAGLLSIHHPAE